MAKCKITNGKSIGWNYYDRWSTNLDYWFLSEKSGMIFEKKNSWFSIKGSRNNKKINMYKVKVINN